MTEQHSCQLCMRSHPLRHCRKFISMTPNEREVCIHENGYCRNCLARSHSTKSCDSPNTCKECGLTHHTMLHPSEGQGQGQAQAQGQSQVQSQEENSTNLAIRRRPRRGKQTRTGPSKRGTQNRKPYNNQGPSRRAQPKAKQRSAMAQPHNLPSLLDLIVPKPQPQPKPQPNSLLNYSFLIQRPPVMYSTGTAHQGFAAASYANGGDNMIPEPPSPPHWN